MRKIKELFSNRKKKKFMYISKFKNGRAKAIKKQSILFETECRVIEINEKYDEVGKTAIDILLTRAEDNFHNGHCIAVDNAYHGIAQRVIVDKDLNVISNEHYDNAIWIEEDYLWIKNAHMKQGILDENLNAVIEIKYELIRKLKLGIYAAIYKNEEEKDVTDVYEIATGIIKTVEGKIMDVCYIDIDAAKKSNYIVCKEGKYGVLDERFDLYVQPEMDEISKPDENGIMVFKKDQKRGIIDGITRKVVYL